MPLLITITAPGGGGQFVDDAAGLFVSDSEGVFEDSIGELHLSTENFRGNRYWSGDIINIDPIAWRMDQVYGGACRLSGNGSIEIALAAFDSNEWWFQGATYPCRIEYTDTLEDAAILLFNCTLHIQSVNLPLSVSYDVFHESYDKELLSTGVNYDGETVPLPMAFGTVTHVKPVRLADSATLIDGWTQIQDMSPAGRYGAVCTAIGTKIYFGLGIAVIASTSFKDWWVHDTSAQIPVWTQKKDFPGLARWGAVCAAVGTKIYVGTGYAAGVSLAQKDWYEYDTTTDTWTTKLSLTLERTDAACAVVGTKIYVGTGVDINYFELQDWNEYDTVANTWTAKTDYSVAVKNIRAVGVGSLVYCGLGTNKVNWWSYNPGTNAWTALLDFPVAAGRQDHVLVSVGTKIFLITGFSSVAYKDCWVYDTVANTWTQRNNFSGAARTVAVGCVIGTTIYVGTGAAVSGKDWWKSGAVAMRHQYSAGGLTSLTVFDDGVDVSSNASAVVNNVFTYAVQPVGALTISGTSPYVYTHQIIPYLCGASFLNLGYNMAFSGITPIDRWVDSQVNVIDFLSAICAAETIYFWVQAGALNVRSFVSGYSPAVVVDVADDALDGTKYFYNQPASLFRAKWKSRFPVEESIGKYVKEIDQEETLSTGYPYGSEIEIDVFTETRSAAATRLAAIFTRYHLTQTSLTLPLQNVAVKPGDALTISDDRFTGREIVAKAGIIRDLIFDPINKKWSIEADGNFFT